MEAKWEDVYSKTFGGQWYPSEGTVRFVARYLRRRVGIDVYDKKRETKRVLDAGCGNGRHVIFLAEQGFDVYGIDISAAAIEIANAWLAKKGLKAHLEAASTTKLPFTDGYFDVVVSFGVLDHITFPEAKTAIAEIRRVLADDGYLYITLRATEDAECGRGEQAGKNTYLLQEGYEKGIIQHFFDMGEIEELLDGFKIFDIERYDQRFPDVYTVDKAFLQSSKGIKKYFDITKPLGFNLQYSRWHIVAEK